jgi:hypothetical protein
VPPDIRADLEKAQGEHGLVQRLTIEQLLDELHEYLDAVSYIFDLPKEDADAWTPQRKKSRRWVTLEEDS